MSPTSLPVTFRALSAPAAGAPLALAERTVSALQPGELLVRVACASVNPMDAKSHRFNVFQLPLPLLFGADFSGTVVAAGATGADSTDVAVGAEVCGFTMRGGAFGEYIVVPRATVVPRGGLEAAPACTLGVAWTTAYESLCLASDAVARPGRTIYIAGAAGGVGHFAVQLAKMHGLEVIGSASRPASLALLRALQVDHVLDHSTQDVAAEVRARTGGHGAELVFDPTYSAASFAQSAAAVAAGGQWIKLGQSRAGEDVEARKVVQQRGASFVQGDLGRYYMDPEWRAKFAQMINGLAQGVRWCAAGKVRPHIAATLPFTLAALQGALDDSVQGRGVSGVGKTVVQIGS